MTVRNVSAVAVAFVLVIALGIALRSTSRGVGAQATATTPVTPTTSFPTVVESAPTLTSVPVPGFSPFPAYLPSGAQLESTTAADCSSIDNVYLADWCRVMTSADPLKLPIDGGDASDNPKFYVAFARALLGDDDSVCASPAVDRWVTAMAHAADGTAACRASLQSLRAQGWFGVTDPASGQTLVIPLK